MEYIEAKRLAKRERETEAWVRTLDAIEIVEIIHERDDWIEMLEKKLEEAQDNISSIFNETIRTQISDEMESWVDKFIDNKD